MEVYPLHWRGTPRRLLPAVLLCALGLSARATIDMAMNTTNFVAGQASTLSVDGVITPGGTSTSITATHLTIRFDPAKLTLSTFPPPATGHCLERTRMSCPRACSRRC